MLGGVLFLKVVKDVLVSVSKLEIRIWDLSRLDELAQEREREGTRDR